LCLLSLGWPIATPFLAIAGSAALYGRRHTNLAKVAFLLCAFALLLSLVIDFGLLATTVSAGTPQRS
jgi:hypothetical protein